MEPAVAVPDFRKWNGNDIVPAGGLGAWAFLAGQMLRALGDKCAYFRNRN